MDDELRADVIGQILNPKSKEEVKEDTAPIADVEVDAEGKSKPREKYNLDNSLMEVLENRKEQFDLPRATDDDRKKCNETFDKRLLRSMMGDFRL